jgi:hypothetical protein
VALAVACATSAASAAPNDETSPTDRSIQLSVGTSRTWTDSMVDLRAGETATVVATGFVRFGNDSIAHVAPSGLTSGESCYTITNRRGDFPAPTLRCWSLIARINADMPQEVGASGTVGTDRGGRLFLGVNDNYLGDNGGAWSVTITVAPPVAAADGPRIPWQPLGLIVSLVLIVFLVLKADAKRRPTYALPAGLLIGEARIRITATSLERVDAGGETARFEIERDDFVHTPTKGRSPRFAWRGLQFSIARSRRPFSRGRGDVHRLGQHVAGSGGTVKGHDGFRRGVIPLSLNPAWAFTLDAVTTATDGDEYVEGVLTMLVVDEHFDTQAAELTRSLQRTLAKHIVPLASRQSTVVVDSRVPVSSGA